MRIDEITAGVQLRRVRKPAQEYCSVATALREVDRQFRKRRSACNVGLHDLRAAGEKGDIDVLQYFWRDDLGDLNVARELLQQSGVLFGFKQNQLAERKTTLFENFFKLSSQKR